jgi:hypothetical protein
MRPSELSCLRLAGQKGSGNVEGGFADALYSGSNPTIIAGRALNSKSSSTEEKGRHCVPNKATKTMSCMCAKSHCVCARSSFGGD